MFRICLIGSVVFHICLVIWAGFFLPGSGLTAKKQVTYFVLDSSQPKLMASGSKGGVDSVKLSVQPKEKVKKTNSSPIEKTAFFPEDKLKEQVETSQSPVKNSEDPVAFSLNPIKEPLVPADGPKGEGNEKSGTPGGDGNIVSTGAGSLNPTGMGNGNGEGVKGGPELAQPDKAPLKIHDAKPVYPLKAKSKNWEGTVILLAKVKKDGTIGQIEVENSSGYDILDQEAIKAVKRWRYRPAEKNGAPVDCIKRIPIRFKLEE